MQDRPSHTSTVTSRTPASEGRTAATIALLMFLGFVAIVVLLHFLRTDMPPLKRFISDYATGKYGFLMTTAFMGHAVGLGALVIALFRGLPLLPRSWASLVLLSVCSFLMALVGVFPNDLPGASATRSGELHNQASLLYFLLLMIAMLVLSIRLRQAGFLRGGYVALFWLSMTAPIMFVLTFGPLDRAGLVGLGQRLYVLNLLSWLALLANGVRSQALRELKDQRPAA